MLLPINDDGIEEEEEEDGWMVPGAADGVGVGGVVGGSVGG